MKTKLDIDILQERIRVLETVIQGPHDPVTGFVEQLRWQAQSGRLGPLCGDAIALDSWWGRMNGTLVLGTFLAARRAGLVAPFIEVHWPGDELAEWESGDWFAFYEAARPFFARQAPLPPTVIALFWRAHRSSLEAGRRRFADLFARMPRPEQRFADGWLAMGERFAKEGLVTDLETMEKQRGQLPEKVLGNGVELSTLAVFISGMSKL